MILDLFAGPGGWSEGLRSIGLHDVGIEWDRVARRFVAKVRAVPSGCWEWQGVRTARGYGRVRIGGVEHGAHRVAHAVANSAPIPDGYYVCHRCDNPPCVNPAHLFAAPPRVNNEDMVRKGRAGDTRNFGSRNGQAKLTADDVRSIRASGAARKELAREYGVSLSLINQIIRGDAWRWVD